MRKVVILLLMAGFSVKSIIAKDIVFETQPLTINDVQFQVEVAETNLQRQQGLMNRKSLDKGRGMLFKLEGKDSTPCFWMRDTYIPLSIAFINKDHLIVQIESLSPKSEELVCAEYPIRYALEVPQNWFSERGIDIGAKIEGLNRFIP